MRNRVPKELRLDVATGFPEGQSSQRAARWICEATSYRGRTELLFRVRLRKTEHSRLAAADLSFPISNASKPGLIGPYRNSLQRARSQPFSPGQVAATTTS